MIATQLWKKEQEAVNWTRWKKPFPCVWPSSGSIAQEQKRNAALIESETRA
jgi:hypothetical protein